MMKRYFWLSAVFVCLLCMMLASCDGKTEAEKYADKGWTPITFSICEGEQVAKYRNSSNDVTVYYDYTDGGEHLIAYPFSFVKGQLESEDEYLDRVCPVLGYEKEAFTASAGGTSAAYQKLASLFSADSKEIIAPSGYLLEGWYKADKDGNRNYLPENRWDFTSDKIGISGITLYAHWVKEPNYTYEFILKDTLTPGSSCDGKTVYTQKVKKSGALLYEMALSQINAAVNALADDYTFLSLSYSVEGQPEEVTGWGNGNYIRPTDDSPTVQIHVNAIPGKYTVVDTASEFRSAWNGGKSIYLLADIDLEGAALNVNENFSGKILGNGYTVSNFVLEYDNGRNSYIFEDCSFDPAIAGTEEADTRKAKAVGLFTDLDGATVKDITFSDFSVAVSKPYTQGGVNLVYISPLAVLATGNTTVSDVFVKNMTVTRYTGFKLTDVDEMTSAVTDRLIAFSEETVTVAGGGVENIANQLNQE